MQDADCERLVAWCFLKRLWVVAVWAYKNRRRQQTVLHRLRLFILMLLANHSRTAIRNVILPGFSAFSPSGKKSVT